MSLSLYDPPSQKSMIKLLFVVFVVGIRCVSFNVRAPIVLLVLGIIHWGKTSLTLASLLLARILGPYKARTQGTRVKAAPYFDPVSRFSSFGGNRHNLQVLPADSMPVDNPGWWTWHWWLVERYHRAYSGLVDKISANYPNTYPDVHQENNPRKKKRKRTYNKTAPQSPNWHSDDKYPRGN